MILTKEKAKKKNLAVLTDKSFEKMLDNLEGTGVVIENDTKQVVVEHPVKKYCIQFNTSEAPKLPNECVLEKIDREDNEEAVFRSKGGRTYKMQVGTIFLFPC
jgi:hypothetical protein